MKSSFSSLIPFLPTLVNHSTAICRDYFSSSIQFLCSQGHILAGWQLETELHQTIFFARFITPFAEPLPSNELFRRSVVMSQYFSTNIHYSGTVPGS
jgi:hypothetical protein